MAAQEDQTLKNMPQAIDNTHACALNEDAAEVQQTDTIMSSLLLLPPPPHHLFLANETLSRAVTGENKDNQQNEAMLPRTQKRNPHDTSAAAPRPPPMPRPTQ